MPTPNSRFTLYDSTLPVDGVVVDEPLGWTKVILSLVRSPEWGSLVKFFEGNFAWFGPAMEIIKSIRSVRGYNAIIGIKIEISYKAGVWIEFFTGTMRVSEQEEIMLADQEDYIMTVPIVQKDFWIKFVNRFDHSVDLQGAIDVDGNAITPIDKIVLPMPSQKLRQNSEFRNGLPILIGKFYDASFSDPDYQEDFPGDRYFQIDFSTAIKDEIKDKFNLYTSPSSSFPGPILIALYDGVYDFDILIPFTCTEYNSLGGPLKEYYATDEIVGQRVQVYIQKNDEPRIAFNITNRTFAVVSPAQRWTEYDYTGTFNLVKGDQIRIWGHAELQGTAPFGYAYNGAQRIIDQLYQLGDINQSNIPWNGGVAPIDFYTDTPCYLKIQSDTVYETTSTDAYLIKDALKSIVSKITGKNNVVKSNFLDTCAGKRAIFRGKHLRGLPFSEKAFFMSMKEWKNGAFPLLNMCAGYVNIDGEDMIEFEDRSFFFNPTTVVTLSNVGKVFRRYDLEKIYKTLKIGFRKGVGSESSMGLDDPQTLRKYTSDNIDGKDGEIYCDWFMVSAGIERSRRNRIKSGEDDKNDEEIMGVVVTEDGDDWLPEFGTAFNLITGLLNSDFRINVRDTVGHMVRRWNKWLSGSLFYSEQNLFKFNGGEGNYSMTSQFETSDCEAIDDPEPIIDEAGDIEPTEVDYIPNIYEIPEAPMDFETFQLIDANRCNAIGVSRTEGGHVPLHILDLKHDLFNGKTKLIMLQATEAELL